MSIPARQGYSSFTVEVVDDGNSSMYSNGGNGFPVEMDMIPQARLSCGSIFMGRGYNLNLTVAVSRSRSAATCFSTYTNFKIFRSETMLIFKKSD